jgi:dsRNA-specific ribonuclease
MEDNTLTDAELIKDKDIIKTDEGLIFNPYNPLNTEIKLSDVQFILTKYGVPFNIHNMELYRRAFIHSSYTKRPEFENIQQNITIVERPPDCMPLSTKSNENLEYLGDGVLECVTKFMLYRRFPKSDEGFKTEKKIALVKNEAIGKIALEMGLHKWLILSRNAEEKKTRTNLKKLGCLFEAFIGAIFLDFSKIKIKDDDSWFQNVFISGPGFQMAQIFIETVFEKHVDWTALIQNDDNYKNILQVKIQKEFKVTPHYLQISHDPDEGHTMGVYLCLGQPIHSVNIIDAIHINKLNNFKAVQEHISNNDGKIFLFLGQGTHKIKRKAEQIACNEALQFLDLYIE